MSRVNRSGKAEDRYLDLIRQFPLRPIRSEEELDEAVRMVDRLVSQPALRPEEADYLDVLGDLVERYETKAHPIAPVSDGDMLRHLIEARGISQSELAQQTGIAVSTICEVIAGKRSLNRAHIGKLARFFKVSPGVFAF